MKSFSKPISLKSLFEYDTVNCLSANDKKVTLTMKFTSIKNYVSHLFSQTARDHESTRRKGATYLLNLRRLQLGKNRPVEESSRPVKFSPRSSKNKGTRATRRGDEISFLEGDVKVFCEGAAFCCRCLPALDRVVD